MKEPLHSETYQFLRDLLVHARKDAGLSQDSLGRRLGRGQRYISDIENGQHRIEIMEFVDLTKALGLDPLEAIKQVYEVFKSDDERG